MAAPLDELYFKWLYAQVANVNQQNPSRSYWDLLRELYTIEFFWFIPNDANRADDGIQLRYEFLDGVELDDFGGQEWLNSPCSMLEVMVSMAKKLVFLSRGTTRKWFWTMLENIDLSSFSDSKRRHRDDILYNVNVVLNRDYDPNGAGGLFPLEDPLDDQRETELWVQMNAYIIERREELGLGFH